MTNPYEAHADIVDTSIETRDQEVKNALMRAALTKWEIEINAHFDDLANGTQASAGY